MKIYAITDGEYSDYHIERLTTNKELAEAYAMLHGCEVEEFEEFSDLTVIEQAKKYHPFVLVIIDNTGKVREDELKERLDKKLFGYHDDDLKFRNAGVSLHNNFSVMVRADQPLEAIIKNAQDIRAKVLAEQLGL